MDLALLTRIHSNGGSFAVQINFDFPLLSCGYIFLRCINMQIFGTILARKITLTLRSQTSLTDLYSSQGTAEFNRSMTLLCTVWI